MSNTHESIQSKIDGLKTEARRRSAPLDIQYKLVFLGRKTENPTEFLENCLRQMHKIRNDLSDAEKVEFISRHFEDFARNSYTTVRDNCITYQQFKESCIARY